jgi:hypothetical protein
MDEFTADAFVNRDDHLPVIGVEDASPDDAEMDAGAPEGQNHGLKKHLTKSNIKDKLRRATGKTTDTGISFQDRLLEKYASLYFTVTLQDTDVLQTAPTSHSCRRLEQESTGRVCISDTKLCRTPKLQYYHYVDQFSTLQFPDRRRLRFPSKND